MTKALAVFAPKCIVHARSYVHDKRVEAQLNSTVHNFVSKVDKNKITPWTKVGSLRLFATQSISHVVNSELLKPGWKLDDQMDKRTQLAEQRDKEKADWRRKAQVFYNYIPYRTNVLSMLSEFQCIQDGHSSQIHVVKQQIALVSSNIRPIHLLQVPGNVSAQ